MTTSAAERLDLFYEQFSGSDQVLILINADPDAIASAMALKRLLWRRVAGIAISNINTISRPDNLSMIRLLNVSMTHISKINTGDYSKFVLVDSQPDHHELFSSFDYTAVIDHHPNQSPSAPFVDIRPDYGATAAMLTEYIKAAKIKPSAKLATGLFYGIKTDTDDFKRNATQADIRAFQYLFLKANIHLARKIEQADLRFEFLEWFQKALTVCVKSRNRIYAHLGPIMNPDICVLIADFFMRVNTVTWSIVSGVYKQKLVIIVRNDGLRKDAGKFLNKQFGHLGSAGGHKSMARAEIPVKNLAKEIEYLNEKRLTRWLIDKFEKKSS
ncbi:MAG: DHH family phosphoesterase [Desulfobacterales bacterium]|jgi:nanoRNase/pAp phosphatase (c-di-AMP/oligoRNAs hydrolase)|nr:DHH family phosphoesterase [Desulfobacterales bacterium]